MVSSNLDSTTVSGDTELALANSGCAARLIDLGVEQGEQVYTVPTKPGEDGRPVQIMTNTFGIEVVGSETTVYQYVVHIKADLSATKEAVFTKKGRDDFIVRDRHSKCCDILFHAVGSDGSFFKMDAGNHIIYDGQSCLFTTVDLFPEVADVSKKIKLIEIDGDVLANEDLKPLRCIVLEVFATKRESFVISADNLASRTADTNLKANHRGYQMFLELVLNQTCIRETARFACFEHGKVFCVTPLEDGYTPSDCLDVGDGKQLLPGFKKTSMFIEGPRGRGHNNPAAIIDAMKSAFHKEQTVIEKVFEILHKDPSNKLSDSDRDRALGVMKGLLCHPTYVRQHLRIEGIYHDTATTAKFELKEGGTTTVFEYYKTKYNLTLKYPTANLVVCKRNGNSNFYPMELLIIDRDQRVTIPQLTSAQSQKTTRECAVLPHDRQVLIMKGKEAANISEASEHLRKFGIKIYSHPMMVNGRELDGNSLKFQNQTVKATSGKWRPPPGAFIKPAACPKLWAAYAVGTASSRYTERDLNDFIVQFSEVCTRRGLRIDAPAEMQLVPADKIEEKLHYASSSQCQFVFVITDDNITHLHQKYKMIERDCDMIIQDMKMSKALAVTKHQKKLTLENVVNKTNVKLGGLNHEVIDSKKSLGSDQLIIGIGLSKPVTTVRDCLNPLVVGYASNAASSHEFVGDFLLTKSGEDTIVSIEDIIRNAMETYEKHREALPKRVIIYRSGASEGSHGALLSYEIPLARSTVESFNADIKLIYMVVTKDHTHRFFRDQINGNDRATEQNIPAGIVLDKEVTHPACKQFFLNSHTTLQGTAKTPLFSVLADDCQTPLDRLEQLTYTLCHHHQIVSLTTSLPTPLYVANEYAKRGRNLYGEKTQYTPVPVSVQGVTEQLKQLTTDISYKFQPNIADKRVNA